MKTSRVQDQEGWDQTILQFPESHLLQSWTWGALKAKYGWHADRWEWRSDDGILIGAAQILYRSIRGGLTMAYCPRGPLVDRQQPDYWRAVLNSLVAQASNRRAFFIKIDPAIPVPLESDLDHLGQEPDIHSLTDSGWRLSDEQVQFRNTLTLDLRQDEDQLLAGMKQKTRYNIRLAGRKGVQVRHGSKSDLDHIFQMYAETSVRDGFVIRPKDYYLDAWGLFMDRGFAQPLIAEVNGDPVAALIVYRYGKTAYYLYGMSRTTHREKMPNHLLQWEAIRWSKLAKCETYDFWGAPHELNQDDPMYGVYRFKLGFGANLIQTPGAWDYPLRPSIYRLYTRVMPRLLTLMRRMGRSRTRTLVQDL